jgi:hypothetical protein
MTAITIRCVGVSSSPIYSPVAVPLRVRHIAWFVSDIVIRLSLQ